MLDRSEPRFLAQLLECEWTTDSIREAYDLAVDTMEEAGFQPQYLAARVPGIGKPWKTFKGRRKRLESAGFDELKWVSLSYVGDAGVDPSMDWLAYISITRVEYDPGIWLGWVPACLGKKSEVFFKLLNELARLGRATHGFCTLRNMLNKRRSWWIGCGGWIQTGLLDDLHAINLLNERQLDAPFGRSGVTLREWIDEDSSGRGRLEHVTDALTAWHVPIDTLPETREKVFRAGRIYCKRFLCPYRLCDSGAPVTADFADRTQDKSRIEPEPYFRPSLSEPWEADGDIPREFRAANYDPMYGVREAGE
ncbi:MAG: hypothetical protein AAF432_01025 [Planctomycetota bacterium]